MRKTETYEWKWREIEEAVDGVFLFWDYEYLEAGRSRTEILSFTCLLHLLYEGEKEEVLKGKRVSLVRNGRDLK